MMPSGLLLLLLLLFLEDGHRHIINRGVIKNHYAPIGTRLYVDTTVLPKLIVGTAEIVADGLSGYV